MDFYKQIETDVLLRNNSPVADFENLSPTNFHHILYNNYSENSPVYFQKNISDDTLDQVSLFRVAEDLIKIIEREKLIKLTPLGALPRKVMVELYDKKYVYDYFIESGITTLTREQDCIAILSARLVTEIAGITKKANGKLTLTKKGATFLKTEKRQDFFKLFITTFADKFNWGFNDGYPQKPIGQFGWTFTIYLLGKFEKDYQLDSFYSKKYLTALPDLLKHFTQESYSSIENQFERCYSVRTFDRFLVWFGLVEIKENEKNFITQGKNIKATENLRSVFKIDI